MTWNVTVLMASCELAPAVRITRRYGAGRSRMLDGTFTLIRRSSQWVIVPRQMAAAGPWVLSSETVPALAPKPRPLIVIGVVVLLTVKVRFEPVAVAPVPV